MRGLLVFMGECFRSGEQGSRTRDRDEAFEPQRAASASHMAFIRHIGQAHGCPCDVVLATYGTRFQRELLEWYEGGTGAVVGHGFQDRLVGVQRLVNGALLGTPREDDYDFVFAIRIDLHLDGLLFEVFDPSWGKVMFPTVCWIGGHKSHGVFPRVNDTMTFIPRAHFGVVRRRAVQLSHDAFAHYVRLRLLAAADIDVMLETFHDSDSRKDFQPLYHMVSRPRATEWVSAGHTVDRATWDPVAAPDHPFVRRMAAMCHELLSREKQVAARSNPIPP